MEDIPSLAFRIPKKRSTDAQIIGFRLALPMVYINSSALFCATTEMATDMANNTILWLQTTPPHTLNKVSFTRAARDTGTPMPS